MIPANNHLKIKNKSDKHYPIYIKKGIKIHFIGIGGKGLNGIAKICIQCGCEITGSDINENEETRSIAAMGAMVYKGHNKKHINPYTDVVVRSSIISKKCEEILQAYKLGIPVLRRSEFLKILMRPYRKIVIAGSHGKSTTTALFGIGLLYAGYDPTIINGAYMNEVSGYEHLGNGKDIVVEACEYDRSFHDLIGDVGIITSVEKSHMEYYKSEESMIKAFEKFMNLFLQDSILFVNNDNPITERIIKASKCKVITYGTHPNNSYILKNFNGISGKTSFSVFKAEREIIQMCIKIPGIYNALNFTGLVAYFDYFNIPFDGIQKLSATFTGVRRRFEIKAVKDRLVIIDDFAHHPTQVENLLQGIKQFWNNHRICVVFQPRQYHLIKTFLKEYAYVLANADEVILTDIVSALGDTKEDIEAITTKDIIDAIRNYSPTTFVLYENDFSKITQYLKKFNGTKTVITTVGAGDIYKVSEHLLQIFEINK